MPRREGAARDTAGDRPLPCPKRSVHAVPGLAQHVAEDPDELVELRLLRDERRRDLDDGVAAIVGAADQAALEEPPGQEAAQERLRLLRRERLTRLLVAHELERVEVARPAHVA